MRVLLLAAVMALLVGLLAAPAFAAPNPNGTGQPSQSCEDPNLAPAAPQGFSTGGFMNAQGRYANFPESGQGAASSNNPKTVSQYDVACFQRANRG